MGLMAGPVPARVSGPAKQALISLVEHATSAGFSQRWACRQVGIDPARLIGWQRRAAACLDLADRPAGPAVGDVPHGLLPWEENAIVDVATEWTRVDFSHRKLAHRASRLGVVFVSESTVLRVLTARGVHLPGNPIIRERRAKRPFPDWVEPVPGQIFIYDFTHFTGLRGWACIAVLDVISKKWLSTVLSTEETSTQVEVAFIAAVDAPVSTRNSRPSMAAVTEILRSDVPSRHVPAM
ncbi:helix-turn-helix domain-containing protein [Micrococcales bacterium 31B]|nr:helix-turn-helix domain-containing protein [Micrococcales bacterium 31B]